MDTSKVMKLEDTVIVALGLLPKQGTNAKDAKSVFGVLNKCRSAQGSDVLRNMLLNPLTSFEGIEHRLDCVEFFVDHPHVRQTLHDKCLRGLPDLIRISKQFRTKKATLSDCVKLYRVLKRLPQIRDLLADDSIAVIQDLFVKELDNCIAMFTLFIDLVENTIDLEHTDSNREYIVKACYNEELQEIDERLESCRRRAEKVFSTAAKDLGLEKKKTLKMECNDNKFLLRVTKNHEKALRNNSEYRNFGIIKNDGVRFTCDDLTEISEEYSASMRQYQEAQKAILDEIQEVAVTYADGVAELEAIISNLDVYTSLAVVAVSSSNPFVRPKMMPQGSGKLVIKQVRHPCVDAIKGDYIPNDVSFDAEKQKFFLVTGPNMGGKSCYILSVGICVLLAQMGCFVPAESAEISVVDGIYSRVGANDVQLQGNSTFMTEMLETSAVLKTATSDSLIIIDELGRGTSTFDGFGIAWSISEHIAKELNSYCLFATHYHELTRISKEIPTIGNLHVSASTTNDNITMLYQVNQGVCDQSFGIHAAKCAHFPDEMIEAAKNKLAELEGQYADDVDMDTLAVKLRSMKDVDAMTDEEVRQLVATF